MSSVVNALRTTPKGQLSYSRTLDTNQLKDELDQLSSPPLSHYHAERNSSLNESLNFGLNTSHNNSKDFNKSSCLKHDKNDEDENSSSSIRKSIAKALSELDDDIEKSDSLKVDDVFETSLPVLSTSSSKSKTHSSSSPFKKQASSCPVSPQFGITTSAILDEEAMWDSFAQLCLLKRASQFEDHERALSYLMKTKREQLDQQLQKLVLIRDGQVKQKQDECLAKSRCKLARLKEDHQEHLKRMSSKQEEIACRKAKLEEEAKRRKELELSRTRELMRLIKEVQSNRNEFVRLMDGFPLKDQLPDVMEKYREVLDKVCSSMNQDINAATPVTNEELVKAQENSTKSLKAVTFLKTHIADVEEKQKEEERKKEVESKKREEENKLVAEAAQDLRVQSLAYVLKEHQSKANLLAETENTVQAFISNTDKSSHSLQMKKFRFDLQRAVNTPINAISPVSGSHLRDKLQRLHTLLTGRPVEVSNKQVAIGDSKEGKVFCENLVAKMLVKKGEEQVTSNHESAYAIATVVVGLWEEIPVVGELFLAHLQATCPYILPLYNTRKEGQSAEDYHRSKGYKIMEDKSVEEQDKFLHRMSGLMHLYCACMVVCPPKGPASPHPLGIDQAWQWLGRTLNLEPQTDVTASMIYDMLYVTGHFLLQRYKNQFLKMLHIIYTQFLPKLKSVSVTKSTVGRLEIFLETAIQNKGLIEPPKGLLPPNFLLS